jgi:hypothetical protein
MVHIEKYRLYERSDALPHVLRAIFLPRKGKSFRPHLSDDRLDQMLSDNPLCGR